LAHGRYEILAHDVDVVCARAENLLHATQATTVFGDDIEPKDLMDVE
jgi:hypothetical protein